MVEEKAHSKFSASGSERWLNCPGSIRLSKDVPPEPDSPYALEGTKAHSLLEAWLEHVKAKKGGAFVYPKGTWPQNMKDAVRIAIEHVKAKLGDAELVIEKKVSLAHIHPDMFGTTDIGIVEEFGRLAVWDYKHGAGVPVNVRTGDGLYELNTQLVYYALGLAHEYDYNFDDVEIGVIQPRADHKDGPVRSEVIDVRTLKAFEDLFRKGVERALKPDAPLYANEKWCRWCPAKRICPEITKKSLVAIRKDFEPVTEAAINLPDPKQMPAQMVSKVLESAGLLEIWIDAVKEHARNELAAGRKIPGYELGAGQKRREWRDEDDAAFAIEDLLGEDAYEKKLLSPAKVEKALPGEKTARMLRALVVEVEGNKQIKRSKPSADQKEKTARKSRA